MSKKVFISYSHKDEEFKDHLVEHLSQLKRQGDIEVWNDRMITSGDEWKGVIDENLETSQIVLFLVSSSFLSSDYCLDVEFDKALELDRKGVAKLIPIIVRSCDWKTGRLGSLQACPKDAEPVNLWPDKDVAWLNVVESLKGVIDTFNPSQKSLPLVINKNLTSELLKSQFNEELEDTEIVLTHRKVDRVKLSDIYIWPDLRVLSDDEKKKIDYVNSNKLLLEGCYLILGEEQQGKTALLKQIFKSVLDKGLLPLYLDAKKVNTSKLDKVINKALNTQYESLDYETFLSKTGKVFLIDNYDEIGLNAKFQKKFLENVGKVSDYVILTANDSFGLVAIENIELNDYTTYEILGFGHSKREEIVLKWVSLGVEESIDDVDLYSACDELKQQLNTIINKNIVPPKPINILLLLQMFEAYAKQNIELTSFGHCYQQLIYTSFDNARIKKREFDKYLNVLTEISWEIYIKTSPLTESEVDDFFVRYGKDYLPVDQHEVVSKLENFSILHKLNGELKFKYPYIYYFFVGKKIADCYIDSEFVRNKVEYLLETLHREDSANILIFITHHTKNSWVLEKIQNVLSQLFQEQEAATLTKEQLVFMDEFIKAIPDLVIEKREINKERERHNRKLDLVEQEEHIDNEDFEDFDVLANINKTFKGMEIAGQIIRNRHANLTKRELLKLADYGASAGLRCLDYFIEISDYAKSEIINHIEKKLENHPSLTDKELEKFAESAYLYMTYGVINGVVKKIASSIGSKDAIAIYDQLEDVKKTPAFHLIKLSVQLQHQRVVDMKSILEAKEKLSSNPVCMRILKQMIVQHIYMFPVEYKIQQQLSAKLDISIKGQQNLKLKGKGKG